MPRLNIVRTLSLARASQPGRPRHLSAASGLATVGGCRYVIADDELHLGVFPLGGQRPGRLVRLRSGTLPLRKGDRKRRKPDFEAIVALPPFARFRSGALLVLGSGSRPNRRRGVLVPVDRHGAITGRPRTVDLSPVYGAIGKAFAPNIEAAFVEGDCLALLQRGNKNDATNARIRVALPPVLDALAAGDAVPRSAVLDICQFDLGSVEGVPLCFTDAAALSGGGFAFTAVAEDTDDSYADGSCLGSAIGIVDRLDRLAALWRLEPSLKVEGIEARRTGRRVQLMIVTDADDARRPALLLQGSVNG